MARFNTNTRSVPVISTGGGVHVSFSESDLKSITVNGGEVLTPDAQGNINIHVPPIIEIDPELSDESTNPVENRVVLAAINAAKAEMHAIIDNIVGGNASAAIDNLNEVLAFLSGITDDETLQAKLRELSSAMGDKLDRDDIEVISDITYDFREANGQLDNTKIYMVYEFESAPIGGGTPRPL